MLDLATFRRWLEDRDRSPGTAAAYSAAVRGFAAWFEQANGEELSPERITPLDVREYRRYLVDVRRLAPATVNRHLAALRSFSRWARESGLIEADPGDGIKGIRQDPSPPRWLTRREQYALLRALQKEAQLAEVRAGGDLSHPAMRRERRNTALVALMLFAGLRVSEVAALRLDDVEINERSGWVTVRRGKGRKWRQVPLNAAARRALRAWLEARSQAGIQAGIGDDNDVLFIGQTGKAMSSRAIQKTLAKYARLAGLEDRVTPHVLRHTFAKGLVDAGVSLDRVATLMGHSSLDTTAIYTKPGPGDLARAVEEIDWT